ncbi:MAG: haloacid dehalogenase type II [Acidobacteriaceae bacterium]|nr:haloacid dehalogenase type II [Acidobacteriaceae bacterium]
MPHSSEAFENIELNVNGFRFNGITAGPKEGQLVLFLHGFPQFADSWKPVMQTIAGAGYRTMAIDQRGYSPGARPRDVKAYATENLIADVLGFASALGASTFHLVGHDWGGLLGWEVAAAYPDRILSLTVLSLPHKNALIDALKSDADQKWRSKYIPIFRSPGHIAEALLESAKYKRLRLAYEGKVPKAAIDRNVRRFSEPYALTAALNWYRALELDKPIGKVPVPVLFIWGSADMALGRTAAERTSVYVTGPYRFEPLEGKSHWLIEEVPDFISGLLIQHLTANPQPIPHVLPSPLTGARTPQAILFDLNGTLLDTRALAPVLRKIFGRRLSVHDWFSEVITYAMATTLAGDYRPFPTIALAVLEKEAYKRGIALTDAHVEKMRKALRSMPAFCDVKPALRRLGRSDIRLGILSNSPESSMGEQLKRAGLDGYFDKTFSVDAVKRFKPALEPYQAAARTLKLEPGEILMIAAHPWDLLGAARAGFRTALVAREENSTFPGAPPAEFVARNMSEVADHLVAGRPEKRAGKFIAVSAGALTVGLLGTLLYFRSDAASPLGNGSLPEDPE